MEATKVLLTCKDCGYENVANINDEEYNNDYAFICASCHQEQPLSYYDYYPI